MPSLAAALAPAGVQEALALDPLAERGVATDARAFTEAALTAFGGSASAAALDALALVDAAAADAEADGSPFRFGRLTRGGVDETCDMSCAFETRLAAE